MKALVITNLYPPHALGGYEMSCRDVVELWRERGHVVDVLTTSTTFHDPVGDPDEPHVHRDLEWYWNNHELERPPPRQRLARERRNHAALVKLLDELQPDVVSLWAMGGMSVGLITTCIERKQPMALVMEDDWLVYAPVIDAWTSAWSTRPNWQRRIATKLTGLPTLTPNLPPEVTVAFASDYLRRRAKEDGRIGFSSTEIVPLGTNAHDFPVRRDGARPWSGRLLSVGRIEPRKGFDVAVRALADLPDATLRIVGPSDERYADELLRLARELGVADRLTLDSSVDRTEIAGVYAASDVFLFLSRWDEPFGLVPLEAMTQATPVVATRRGGSAEFLTDHLNCLEVPVDDDAAVARAVKLLERDEPLRRKLVNGGLTTGAAYRVDRFADGLERVHLSVAGLS